MQKIPVLFAGALSIIAFVFGMGLGYYFTPQYKQAMSEKNMDLGAADRLVDLRYLNAMIAHHRGAIFLAKQAEKSERKEVRSLATDIQTSEPKLIDELFGWKREWYDDIRPVRDPEGVRLGTVDKTFDLRFLNALIAHHEAGIVMTREIRLKSSRSEVLDNADAVESFLKTSSEMLRGWRSDWYNVK